MKFYMARVFGVGALFLFLPCLCFGNEWSRVEKPAPGPPLVIGNVSCGCISGAVELPKDGLGYKVMHLERRRCFGHPDLVEMIIYLGQKVKDENLGMLYVGDLAQPIGGPSPSDHVSHQNGLDVDIWSSLDPNLAENANETRSDIGATSLLNENGTELNRSLWSEGHSRILQLIASHPRVDRIFVNPHIKKELCETAEGDRGWLRKIRPWWGHADHFHIRLSCPVDSPKCERQKPLPAGEGCDAASLDWWLTSPTIPPKKSGKKPRTGNNPPNECQKLLRGITKKEKK